MSDSGPLSAGDRLDRYELLCVLAQGGMGAVWLARLSAMLGFEKLYALKTILPQFADDPRFRDMFLDEARLTSRIRHENVAQIIDMGEAHGCLYYAMEYIDGESLRKVLRDFQAGGDVLPVGVACRIVADVCAGLHAAHELCDANGEPLLVVHRDVSPQNVLVSPRGQVRLIDFGVAKARDRLAAETSLGTLKGKVDYMAPEQARGQKIDRRADVYAVGAILYELLSGRAPYENDEGRNQLVTLQALMSGTPPVALPAHIPTSLRDVVMRALAHDPNDRHATAADLERAIEEAAKSSGSLATSSEVAAAIEAPLRTRTTKRRQAVDDALKAAADRAASANKLAIPIESASGLVEKPPSSTNTEFGGDPKERSGSLTRVTSASSVIPTARRRGVVPLIVGIVGLGFVAVAVLAFTLGRARGGDSHPSTSAVAPTVVPAPSTTVVAAAVTTTTKAEPVASAEPDAGARKAPTTKATTPPHKTTTSKGGDEYGF